MPNIIDANGLLLSTRAELITFYTNAFQTIYGSDITLASDSPDGQMMNIWVQAILDLQDLLNQIYNMFDPDNAIGVILDQRVAINGIQREAGTFTITDVTLVNSQSINLYGLDQTVQPVYTVADNAGNQWQLQVTTLGLSAGTHVLSFQAALPGAQLTIPNTINIPVTIVIGVTSVNNPTTYTTLGTNEETDAALKLRRQKSVSLASQGYLAGLLAALENVSGITFAAVYENNTSTTNVDGVPGHSIWVIVSGIYSNADVANAIYTKRNAGAGMFGGTTFTIAQIDGSPFVVKWDVVVPEALFVFFNVASINGSIAPNYAAIRAGIPTAFIPTVNEDVNINQLATVAQKFDSNALITGAGFTTARLQTMNFTGVAASGIFKLFYNGHLSASINWDDATPTIQSKLQAVTGLSAVTVSGSIAGQSLVFDLSAVPGEVLGYIAGDYATSTLLTAGSAKIFFTYNENFTATLSPDTKKNQFVVASANIVMIPILLSQSATSVKTGQTVQFSAQGGYGTYVFQILVNNSGGSINSSTGLYTAGATPSVTDTIIVVDVLEFSTVATVGVTA